MTLPADAPLPPRHLAGYVVGSAEAPLDEFVAIGELLADLILEVTGPQWEWDGSRVLDFGCGSARVLRHFLDRAGTTELHGAELDAACVAWIQAHLVPPLQVVASSPSPPLPYPDGHFDLIWSMSVFSHLTDTWAAWLLELRRLVRPGGLVVVSVMGAESSQRIAGEPWVEDRIGMNVLGYGRPWHAGGPMILHGEWWLRAHWGRAFAVEQHLPGAANGQDLVVLRRVDGAAPTVDELVAPEPGEPRELVAARHAIVQLHREHATLNAQHDAYAAAYADEVTAHATARRTLDEVQAAHPGPDGRLVKLARRLSARSPTP